VFLAEPNDFGGRFRTHVVVAFNPFQRVVRIPTSERTPSGPDRRALLTFSPSISGGCSSREMYSLYGSATECASSLTATPSRKPETLNAELPQSHRGGKRASACCTASCCCFQRAMIVSAQRGHRFAYGSCPCCLNVGFGYELSFANVNRSVRPRPMLLAVKVHL